MALLVPHFSQIDNTSIEKNKTFFDVLEGEVGFFRNVKLRR